MRTICSLTVLLVAATGATAQSAVPRSAGFDVGAFAVSEVRLNIEPLTVGRWALNVGFARWSDAVSYRGEFVRTAEQGLQAGLEAMPGNTHLSLDLTLRAYPRWLQSTVPERRFRIYAGVGAGLTQRTAAGPNLECPITRLCAYPLALDVQRSVGVDPLAEIGIRFEPARVVLLDVGVRTRVVSTRDPTTRYDRGDLVPNAVVGVGLRW